MEDERKVRKGRGGELVAVMIYLPRPVVEWLDVKAAARFRRRATHVRDLLVGSYERDQQRSTTTGGPS